MTDGGEHTTAATGLSAAEVAARVADGCTNEADDRTSRTLGEIIRANVLTRFNAMLGALAVAVLLTGNWGDALFAIVLVLNALVGIVQEWRAKATLDRLAFLNAPTATVVRDGVAGPVALGAVVLDDLVEVRAGDQVPADGRVVATQGLEVDESALTGESDPEHKAVGDEVLSGTIVVAGGGRFQATAVGRDAYARRIAAEAKVFTRASSELQEGIDRLLGYVTWVIVGVTPILIWSQIRTSDEDWRTAVTGTVAALVGMIPEGLVLLTTLAFLLAALSLARQKVLVQELPAVEGLARVDVVCLDKTGTLTAGGIVFDALELLDGGPPEAEVRAALGALAADAEANASLLALRPEFPEPAGWERKGTVAFSSARKWSAAAFGEHGTWVLGAPDVLLATGHPALDRVARQAELGQRVLLVAHTDAPLAGEQRPADLVPAALCVLGEAIRPDAAETLAYFARQGVAVKVISGDNPVTVAAIARKVGVDPGTPVDARTLADDDAVAEVIEATTVFGRVSPHQKRAMVRALQANGHTVAMTGDGVNDALALKDADIGVAMGNGAPATRAIAQLVLLDGRFARLPSVLGEGRRVIANIERVASLFVTKNVYSFLLTILVAVAGLPYPFLPRHLTLISSITIGIPAFFLALVPNDTRYTPGFLRRVLRFAIPTGAITSLAIFAAYLLAELEGATDIERQTAATIAALVVALWVLTILARPWTTPKVVLVALMAGIAAAAIAVPAVSEVFKLSVPVELLPQALAIGAAGAFGVELVSRMVPRGPESAPSPAAPGARK